MTITGGPAAPGPEIDLTQPALEPKPAGQPSPAAADGVVQAVVGSVLVAHQEPIVLDPPPVVIHDDGKQFDQEMVVLEEKRSAPVEAGPAPFSIWRRMAAAEARQVELELNDAIAAGNPYPHNPHYNYQGHLADIGIDLDQARAASASRWPRRGMVRRAGQTCAELVRVWTGSEHETAVAALHRAEGCLLMVLPDANLRSEALKMKSIFQETNDVPLADPRHAVYTALFSRIEATNPAQAGASPPPPPLPAVLAVPATPLLHTAPQSETVVQTQAALPVLPAPAHQGLLDAPSERRHVDIADRVLLREVRRAQNESWEIARCRLRIFRNLLSATIPVLTIVLIAIALLSWADPSLISLRPGAVRPDGADVAMVEFLGAFGGLLSAVATIRALRNFQRFYGLPLAQSILKLPAGAATALAGIILLQHGLLGIGAVDWDKVIPYALAFGIAQIAATKQIDSRASDLLGDANAKSPSTTQAGSTSAPTGDIA